MVALAGCGGGTSSKTSGTTGPSVTNAPSSPATSNYTLTSATYTITDKTGPSWTFSYTIVVKNNTPSQFLLSATIQYLAADSSIVSTDYYYGITLSGNQTVTTSGSSHIDATLGTKITSMSVTFA